MADAVIYVPTLAATGDEPVVIPITMHDTGTTDAHGNKIYSLITHAESGSGDASQANQAIQITAEQSIAAEEGAPADAPQTDPAQTATASSIRKGILSKTIDLLSGIGSQSDVAAAGNGSLIAVLKKVRDLLTTGITVTDSATEAGVGAPADAAWSGSGSGSGISIWKKIAALFGAGMPSALGAGGGLKVDGSGTALPVSGTVTAGAGSAIIGKFGVDQTTPGTTNGMVSLLNPGAGVAYRSAVTAADVLPSTPAAPGLSLQSGGGLTAGTYNVATVSLSGLGRTLRGTTAAQATSGGNLTVRAAIAQVTGATGYDVYCSTAADPLWVGRITETQRAAGCVISAVGVVGAGSVAGSVDIQAIGTGNAGLVSSTTNNAYVMPAASPVDCTKRRYIDFDLAFSRTGDTGASPALTVAVFLSPDGTNWFQGQTFVFGLGGTQVNANNQRLQVQVDGCNSAHLIVVSIAGSGASVNMTATPS